MIGLNNQDITQWAHFRIFDLASFSYKFERCILGSKLKSFDYNETTKTFKFISKIWDCVVAFAETIGTSVHLKPKYMNRSDH